MAERQRLQLILPLNEHLAQLGQPQLLPARSRMLVGRSRLERCGPSAWTCGHRARPNPFSSMLSFCAPHARDANSVLPCVREACKGLRSGYRRKSSGPPLDAPLTGRNDRRAAFGCLRARPQASRPSGKSQCVAVDSGNVSHSIISESVSPAEIESQHRRL